MTTSLELTTCSLPDSHVKSPGTLLRDKKDSLVSLSKQKEFQELLCQFRSLEVNPVHSDAGLPAIPNERPTTFIERKNPLNWSIRSRAEAQVSCPGRLKSSTEGMSCLIYKSRELLHALNIELVIHISGNSKEVSSLLKVLIPEICYFPSSFYESLNIKKIVIAKEIDHSFYSHRDTCFLLNDLDTSEKVLQRLHKIIFNKLMAVKSDELTMWQAREAGQIDSLEDTFMALMSNSNTNVLFKFQARKLQEFLGSLYPEAMGESQFKFKAKQKKKMLKVHFDLSILEN